MTGMWLTAKDLWTVAQTCWGEARGEGIAGLYAVAWVIRNRSEYHPRWQRRSPGVVCRAAYQFSCWNASDVNRAALETLSLTDRVFCQCLIAAVEVFGGMVSSPVGRAMHYYADTLAHPPPWAIGSPVAVIGHHLFFEGIA